MPRKAAGLTAAKVRTAKPGRYGDGGGLYLLVRENGRFWVFRYVREGRMREMGLGRAGERHDETTLAEAREKARTLYRQVKAGLDPLAERDAALAEARAAAQREAVQRITFRTVAERYVAAHEAGWRNAKHRYQWSSTLTTYVFPFLGDVPVADVATGHVMAALEPIWAIKPETASRVRGRIEVILDYAAARGWRSGENPARWRGHLANLLPKRSKLARVEHHAALPWRDVGAFMAVLAEHEADSVAALALQFTIFTAARTGETLGARWSEIDFREAVWTVPGERMKAGREHRVPLSAAVLAVLRKAAELHTNTAPDAFVFPGRLRGSPLSQMAMSMLLRRMERADLTVHGFRSTFRDWAAEATNTPRELAEAALAHTISNKVEAAYRWGDMFEKRRRLMEAWAEHCARPEAPPAEVTPIRRRAAGDPPLSRHTAL